MKVLWIVNTIFPFPAEKINKKKTCFGGWLNGLLEEIEKKDSVKIGIATVYKGKRLLKLNDKNTIYYLIPCKDNFKYNKELEKYATIIIKDFEPDILHIHGTEFSHGLAFMKQNKNKEKCIVSIQGLVSNIGEVYLNGISFKEVLKNLTLRNFILHDNLLQQKRKFIKRGKYEYEILNQCKYVIGRTDWDYYNIYAINSKTKYYYLPEIVRKEFYTGKWDLNKIEYHSIYLSQAPYPIKGLHVLLKALKILKKDYPDVKLYISGKNIIEKKGLVNLIKFSSYGKYILKLIKKYKLNDSVIFTGELNEKETKQRLLNTHVVVVPSIIENESNSLTEAHLLGIPTVAAFSGGMTDRIIHKKTGFLYPYVEPSMCAGYISRFFEDDNLCVKMGNEARKIALERNEPKLITNELLRIYKEVIEGGE